jgi:pSer/pThr/pTyr-binding forkhead associated (FHA) protein
MTIEKKDNQTKYKLIGVSGTEIPLFPVTTIGREDNCDLKITEGLLSRQHARILVIGDRVSVEDLDSTNGTFVNGKRISSSTDLSENDEIRFDTISFYLSGSIASSQQKNDGKTLVRSSAEVAGMIADMAPKDKTTAQSAENKIDSEPSVSPAQKAQNEAPSATPPSWLNQKSETVLLPREEMLKNLEKADKKSLVIDDNRTDDCRLIGLTGSIQGQVFSLATSGNQKWDIGREQGLEITINDPSISSRHFQIANDNKRWKLVNLMAANGTFVNGKRRLSCYLDDGDHITAGNTELVFQLPRGSKKTGMASSSQKPKNKSKQTRRLVLALVIVLLAGFIALKLTGLV